MSHTLVSASLLAANPLYYQEEVRSIEKAGIDFHHIDVMDGHFVPNLTFGPPLIKKLKTIATVPLDVHLMISNPEEVMDQYIDAGSDLITFHIEATSKPETLLKKIRQNKIKSGISIKPSTSIETLEPLLESLDLILIMSVEPGFGGQAFIPETDNKLEALQNLLKKNNHRSPLLISVDGGVNASNAQRLQDKGANCLVSGSYLYKAESRKEAIQRLR